MTFSHHPIQPINPNDPNIPHHIKLLSNDQKSWNKNYGMPLKLTYQFLEPDAVGKFKNIKNLQLLSPNEKESVKKAFDSWEAVTDAHFTEVNNGKNQIGILGGEFVESKAKGVTIDPT